jgi:peptide/nickel transport system ATP-binding protein
LSSFCADFVSTGLSILFITHNLALVRSVARRVLVIAIGSVVESGPADEVLDHPRAAYPMSLIRDVPTLTVPVSA